MTEDKFFDFSPVEAAGAVSQAIATFSQRSSAYISESSSPSEDRSNGPGYYLDATINSNSNNTEACNEPATSTSTEVMQHIPQSHQQQLSATMAFHQAAAARQATQVAANAAELQATQAQAMAAVSQSHGNMGTPNVSVVASLSLQQQTIPSVSMSMSCLSNGLPDLVYSDRTPQMTAGGMHAVPMMMQQTMDRSQGVMLQRDKGGKNMPPTPPASADEKDNDYPRKKKPVMIPPNVIVSPSGPVPVSLLQLNNTNGHVTMQATVPGPPGQVLPQFAPPNMMGIDRLHMQPDAQSMYNNFMAMPDDEEMSHLPGSEAESRRSNNKRRIIKKSVPAEEKDDKYFERRQRNNVAAKRSRDARKQREDTIAMRANFLERENAILRAQLATLREEANSLRQLLSQRTMPAIGQNPGQNPGQNGQQMNTSTI